jgi:hypothetical protein
VDLTVAVALEGRAYESGFHVGQAIFFLVVVGVLLLVLKRMRRRR